MGRGKSTGLSTSDFLTGVPCVACWVIFTKSMAMEYTPPRHRFSRTYVLLGSCALGEDLVRAVDVGVADGVAALVAALVAE